MARGAVDGFGDVFQDEVEEDLVAPVAAGVEKGLELDDVGVLHLAHDLQLAVLKALVLEDALDGGILARADQLGLEDDAEGAIAHDLALCIREVPLLAGRTVVHSFLDDLAHAQALEGVVHGWLSNVQMCRLTGEGYIKDIYKDIRGRKRQKDRRTDPRKNHQQLLIVGPADGGEAGKEGFLGHEQGHEEWWRPCCAVVDRFSSFGAC